MPRYFFHVRNHVHTRDTEGMELADEAAAHGEALLDIADIKSAEFGLLGGHWHGWSIEICDESGDIILIVPFIAN